MDNGKVMLHSRMTLRDIGALLESLHTETHEAVVDVFHAPDGARVAASVRMVPRNEMVPEFIRMRGMK